MIQTSFASEKPVFTNHGILPISELFQKLSDTSELVKELNSLQRDSRPEAYASLMLTEGLDENNEKMVFNWVLNQLTIGEDWPSKWNQASFDEALSHLNFNQQFALLAGMYRLAKLGENNETIKKHFQEAAAIFKKYLIHLIHQYPANYPKLDLTTFSLKNSTALRFDQTALSYDFLNIISKQSNLVPREILKENHAVNDVKISLYAKTAIGTAIVVPAIAATTYFIKSFMVKPIPPPPESFQDVTKKFINDHYTFFSFGLVALATSYFVYTIHRMNTENKQLQEIMPILYALQKIEDLEINEDSDISFLAAYIEILKKIIPKFDDKAQLGDAPTMLSQKLDLLYSLKNYQKMDPSKKEELNIYISWIKEEVPKLDQRECLRLLKKIEVKKLFSE